MLWLVSLTTRKCRYLRVVLNNKTMIKFGSIEHMALLDFNDKLKYRMLDRLDLVNLDRLRNEIELKIMEIHTLQTEYLKERNSL